MCVQRIIAYLLQHINFINLLSKIYALNGKFKKFHIIWDGEKIYYIMFEKWVQTSQTNFFGVQSSFWNSRVCTWNTNELKSRSLGKERKIERGPSLIACLLVSNRRKSACSYYEPERELHKKFTGMKFNTSQVEELDCESSLLMNME